MEPALRLLREGEVEVEGRMPWSSNATFLVTVTRGDQQVKGIYKPVRGERPLWDFPSGLHKRELAAWLLSEHLGWGLVPPTVIREGPFGEGSVQLFMPADFEQHYFSLYEGRPDLHDRLRAVCAFDVVANNTDRKSGHCLLGLDGEVYAIDHGLCFAADFKLRTVIWEFAGEDVPDHIVQDVARVAACVPPELAELLDDDELEAMQQRATDLAARRRFPIDRSGHRYPWPLV